MTESIAVKTHQPCPDCGSSDALTVYTDHTYCFSCCTRTWNDGSFEIDKEPFERKQEKMVELVSEGRIREIADRCISEETCSKFGVRTFVKDKRIQKHFYDYYDKAGNKVATKIRVVDTKQFFWEGIQNDLQLFGAQCQPTTGRSVIVTEGEIDCLTMYQVLGGRATVVSIPAGCRSYKAIKDNYEYLTKFDSIVLCWDGDKPGREAVEQIAQILPPKKTKIMRFAEDLKDPNAMLMAGKSAELVNLFYRAEEYRPKDIVNIGDMFERLSDYRKTHEYTPTPWSGLNEKIQGTRPGQLIVLAAGCVSADTEFFTGSGWKRIADYQEGDKVLQYDPDIFKATLVEPEAYIKKPCEWFYRFKTKYGLDMVLSPEHNVLCVPENSLNHYKISAEEVAKKGSKFRGRIPTAFRYTGKGINLTDVEIKLMIAVIADSTVNNSKSVTFHIKKDRKKQELRKILEEYGEHYNWYERKNGYVDVTVRPPMLDKEFKQFWYNCTDDQLKVVCDNVLKWDGCTANNRKSFSTTSKASADFVQFAFESCGYRAKLSYRDREGKSREYIVTISERNFVGLRNYKGPEKVSSVDGFKYCFTVPTHCLVLRHNGCVFCTGNTGMGKSAFLKSWMQHLVNTTDLLMGALYLEENPEETVISLMSLAAGKNLKKNAEWDACSPEELKTYFEACGANRRIELFEPLNNTEPEYICDKIRYLAAARGCKVIFLDHLTYVVDDSDDPRRALNKLVKTLHDICVELGIVVIAACHLRKSTQPGKSHEEGCRVTLDDLKDSSSIKQLSDVAIGLERNSQDDDPVKANTTLLRVLKNRDFGEKGPATALLYEKETTRLIELGLDFLQSPEEESLKDL